MAGSASRNRESHSEVELAADGPLREHYLVGPLETLDESAWRTEIGWPIVKVAEGPH